MKQTSKCPSLTPVPLTVLYSCVFMEEAFKSPSICVFYVMRSILLGSGYIGRLQRSPIMILNCEKKHTKCTVYYYILLYLLILIGYCMFKGGKGKTPTLAHRCKSTDSIHIR